MSDIWHFEARLSIAGKGFKEIKKTANVGVGEQTLQKMQIYPMLSCVKVVKIASFQQTGPFEHRHLCCRRFRWGFFRRENKWVCHHQGSFPNLGFYDFINRTILYTDLSKILPPPRTGSPPAPSRWSPTHSICWISSPWTSSCFQRWRSTCPASNWPRRASRRPGEGSAEVSPPRTSPPSYDAGLSGAKSVCVSAVARSRKSKK